MDAIDCLACNVDRALETKGDIRSVYIIVDRLRKMNDIQAFLAQQVCSLLCSVAPKDHDAIQIQLIIILLHRFYLIQTVFIRYTHQLERLS